MASLYDGISAVFLGFLKYFLFSAIACLMLLLLWFLLFAIYNILIKVN